jgi:hypothetical protein
MGATEASSPLPPGMRTFELPPDGFNPMTASAEELRRYGLPRRPDPDSEPHLARLFARAFSRPRTFTKPELVVDSRLDAIHAKREGKSDFFSPGDWGGTVVTTPAATPPNVAFARFQVPTVANIDPFLVEELITGFWVGIGGFHNNSLLQAGIAAAVTPLGVSTKVVEAAEPAALPVVHPAVSYWAWTEWYPNGSVINNLAISPGDAISVLVCARQPDNGFVLMENNTTNQILSIGVDPPDGVTADGPSAEWIVESLSVNTADFTPWTCFNCQAGRNEANLTLTGATTLNMEASDVQTVVTSPSSATVTWENFG